MSTFSPLFDMLGQEVLSKKGDGHMWGYSDIESQVSNPEMGKSFTLNCLDQGIENVFVGILSVRPFLHFLELCFSIIEGQAAERGGKS